MQFVDLMEEYNWELVKEADIDLFGEHLDSENCSHDESKTFDSMKALYGTKYLGIGGCESSNTDSTISDKNYFDDLTANFTVNGSFLAHSDSDDDVSEYEDEKRQDFHGGQRVKNSSSAAATSTFQSGCDMASPTTTHSGSNNHYAHSDEDDAIVDLYHTEMEFQELIASQTDPVGKFIKKVRLTAQDALALNIQDKLLNAPRKPRTKYGKRKIISPEERLAVNRERNRIHARSTRMRKRLFKEIQNALSSQNQQTHQTHQQQHQYQVVASTSSSSAFASATAHTASGSSNNTHAARHKTNDSHHPDSTSSNKMPKTRSRSNSENQLFIE